MKKDGRVRVFSAKRLGFSIVLGFLIPLSYAVILSLVSDLTGRAAPELMVTPFGWPRPLWILFLGRQPAEGDLVGGIAFMAFCNIALYGALIYVALLGLSMGRIKRAVLNPPPAPESVYSHEANSD